MFGNRPFHRQESSSIVLHLLLRILDQKDVSLFVSITCLVKYCLGIWWDQNCYGTRSRTHFLCCTFTTFNYWFSSHVHCSHCFLRWHFPICCMVVNFPFLYFLSWTLISQVDDASTRFPLVTPVPWPSTTFHYSGPCAYPGHINTAPFVLFTLS